ncbi:hypothetical protein ADICEAN_00889 [Cesiribacter andamanensis AMV16]|uniref:Phosphate-selective porin n=1 Tax=Cesiribacter andamanensis AMV16 TaxID=1279009 RepID=M7N5V6_9BACT|nr:hypothetical protein ADICEAN_00889 [Cesiribacter andamanensis AMV16]
MGANNPASGAVPGEWVNGRGNGAPVLGTGANWYLQLAWLRPADTRNQRQLQAYASLQWGRLEALHDPVLIWNTGLHYLLNGQRSKLTLGYQSRPVFRASEHLVTEDMRKHMLVLQYQLLFGG